MVSSHNSSGTEQKNDSVGKSSSIENDGDVNESSAPLEDGVDHAVVQDVAQSDISKDVDENTSKTEESDVQDEDNNNNNNNNNEESEVDDEDGSKRKEEFRTAKVVRELQLSNNTSTKANLDDATLQTIKNYLKAGSVRESLEEEEVVMTAIKTSLYANERTRYRQNLLEGSDMEEEKTVYGRVYKEEENYALGNKFFKTVIDGSVEQTGDAADAASNLSGYSAKPFLMDKRTVAWLKRAAGLQRPYDPLDQQTYMSDEDEGETDVIDSKSAAPRRLTRGKARNIRVKRREDRIRQENQGLNALMEAITELEKERGPFPKSKRFVSSLHKNCRLCLNRLYIRTNLMFPFFLLFSPCR
jgi:hypothetical protein